MRAARFHRYGEPDVLAVEEAPEPRAGAGEIRIRVAATSVNPMDWKIRAGLLAEVMPVEFPAIPGADAAGVVDQVGPGVDGVRPGDRVFGLTRAGAAEFAVLAFWAPIPDTWSTERAAAAGLVSATAMAGLALLGDLAGRTVLIEGAAGGVGSAAAQIAHAREATVIGRASEAGHQYLRSLGITPIGYGAAAAGVDAALDTVGSGSLAELVAVVGDPGRVATVADHRAHALGVALADPLTNAAANLAEVSWLGGRGAYTPRIDTTFPLEKIAVAHAYVQQGRTRGKVVLTV
ncbi:oxidoreductase [Virgisporangium aliadipatigenens]|uniref:Oxidoreductase n=1 Tax=Virgisporangium aliadipatigenens TaxID=741659 RepID=A0A8J4DQU4_9ACTN|nr:NADP-dependent oxidoreductase [Virgisporangium aliadipatigenens]GIJ46093.1 oxidoreductase [Virgisporangium aliadipatigenens]